MKKCERCGYEAKHFHEDEGFGRILIICPSCGEIYDALRTIADMQKLHDESKAENPALT